MGEFQHFDGRGVSRVDLDGPGLVVSKKEIDAEESSKPKSGSDTIPKFRDP